MRLNTASGRWRNSKSRVPLILWNDASKIIVILEALHASLGYPGGLNKFPLGVDLRSANRYCSVFFSLFLQVPILDPGKHEHGTDRR
jgi:hypothetical protein